MPARASGVSSLVTAPPPAPEASGSLGGVAVGDFDAQVQLGHLLAATAVEAGIAALQAQHTAPLARQIDQPERDVTGQAEAAAHVAGERPERERGSEVQAQAAAAREVESTLFNMQRQAAVATGVAVVATVLSALVFSLDDPADGGAATADRVDAFQMAFLVSALMFGLAALVSLLVHNQDARATMEVAE